MAKIQDREATIKTMVVEIKALTVSGKQVTQALLKQLEAARLIDETTLTLRGVPWGRVNYHVGCGEWTRNHLHVVWQDGDELRRDCIEEAAIEGIVLNYVARPEPWYWTAALVAMMEEEPAWDGAPVSSLESPLRNGVLTVKNLVIRDGEADLAHDLRSYWNGGILAPWEDRDTYTAEHKARQRQYDLQHASERIEARLKRLGAQEEWREYAFGEAMDRYREALEARADWRDRWEKLWRALNDLDQLFIAV